jgi:Tetratricopeptide repeat
VLGVVLDIGLLFGLGSGLLGGLVAVLFFVLCVGLTYAGFAVLEHYALRWVFYRNGSLPLHLVSFLDYGVERIFLRRVGDRYIFVHRLLMEHFASLYPGQQAEARQAITFYERQLARAQEIGAHHAEGNILSQLGSAHSALGDTLKVIDYHEQALAIAHKIGDRRLEGLVLATLGGSTAIWAT